MFKCYYPHDSRCRCYFGLVEGIRADKQYVIRMLSKEHLVVFIECQKNILMVNIAHMIYNVQQPSLLSKVARAPVVMWRGQTHSFGYSNAQYCFSANAVRELHARAYLPRSNSPWVPPMERWCRMQLQGAGRCQQCMCCSSPTAAPVLQVKHSLQYCVCNTRCARWLGIQASMQLLGLLQALHSVAVKAHSVTA